MRREIVCRERYRKHLFKNSERCWRCGKQKGKSLFGKNSTQTRKPKQPIPYYKPNEGEILKTRTSKLTTSVKPITPAKPISLVKAPLPMQHAGQNAHYAEFWQAAFLSAKRLGLSVEDAALEADRDLVKFKERF